MHQLLLALSLSAAAPSIVDEAVEPPRTWLWPGTSSGPRFTEGGVGLGALGISYRLHDLLEPEAFIGVGAHTKLDGTGLQVVDRFSFGSRVILPVDEDPMALRPFLWLALHHEHQADWAAVVENPIGTTLGVSSKGVAHYTGAEVGAGVAVPFVVDRTMLQALVRVNVVMLPAWGGHVGDTAMRDQLALLVDVAAGIPLAL